MCVCASTYTGHCKLKRSIRRLTFFFGGCLWQASAIVTPGSQALYPKQVLENNASSKRMRRTYAPNIYRQLVTQFSAKHVTIISRTLLCRRRPIAREISAISQEQPLCIIGPAIDTNPAILEIPIQSDIFKITRMKDTMYLRFGAYLFEICGHVYVLCQFIKTSGRILQHNCDTLISR